MSEIRQRHEPIDFPELMKPVALQLLGPPNPDLSKPGELFWGTRGSLSVNLAKGVWRDHENKTGGGVLALIKRELGLDRREGMKWMREQGHLPPEPPRRASNGNGRHGVVSIINRRVVCRYPYHDADGTLLCEVIRYAPKDFRQCRPDPANPERRIWNTEDVKQTLYRLPEVLAAVARETVHICEGEKACDALRELGRTATCARGGANHWPSVLNQSLKGADVVIHPDNDQAGREHAKLVAKELKDWVNSAVIVETPGIEEKQDIFDWFAKGNTGEDLDHLIEIERAKPPEPEPEPDPDAWKEQLSINSRGVPHANVGNICTVLENTPAWRGVLHWNDMQARLMVDKPIPGAAANPADRFPRPWQDVDTTNAICWFNRDDFKHIKRETVDTAAASVAYNKFRIHPVRNYLSSLNWDGVPRLSNWLIDFCGAEPTDDAQRAYIKTVGPRWMISAVARVFNPGCQADHALVLEGEQGIGKTSVLRILGGEWFSESLPGDLHSKDAADHVRNYWIIELSELSQLRRTMTETVKSFLSRKDERFRQAYGRHEGYYPRQCVFAGTTNAEAYLQDETGNRRFWPVKISVVNLRALRDLRDQLWAEAVHRYHASEPWHLTDAAVIATAAVEQAKRRESDPWEERIIDWLDVRKPQRVTVTDILIQCLDLHASSQRKSEQMRVTDILKNLGWKKGPKAGNKRCWTKDNP